MLRSPLVSPPSAYIVSYGTKNFENFVFQQESSVRSLESGVWSMCLRTPAHSVCLDTVYCRYELNWCTTRNANYSSTVPVVTGSYSLYFRTDSSSLCMPQTQNYGRSATTTTRCRLLQYEYQPCTTAHSITTRHVYHIACITRHACIYICGTLGCMQRAEGTRTLHDNSHT